MNEYTVALSTVRSSPSADLPSCLPSPFSLNLRSIARANRDIHHRRSPLFHITTPETEGPATARDSRRQERGRRSAEAEVVIIGQRGNVCGRRETMPEQSGVRYHYTILPSAGYEWRPLLRPRHGPRLWMQRLGLSISPSLLRCIRRLCRKALRSGSDSYLRPATTANRCTHTPGRRKVLKRRFNRSHCLLVSDIRFLQRGLRQDRITRRKALPIVNSIHPMASCLHRTCRSRRLLRRLNDVPQSLCIERMSSHALCSVL
jgi:hypothetical protein